MNPGGIHIASEICETLVPVEEDSRGHYSVATFYFPQRFGGEATCIRQVAEHLLPRISHFPAEMSVIENSSRSDLR